MQRWVIGLSVAALILSFQNCGSPTAFDQQSGDSSLKSTIEYEDGSYEDANWVGLEFADSSYSAEGPNRYHIDLTSGEIAAVSSDPSVQKAAEGASYCLSDDELQEVRSILDAARVCAPNNDIPPGQLCTMEYRQPYAWLVGEGDRGESVLSLGEKINGCHKATDLCGDYAAILKGFLVSIQLNLESHRCD